MSSAHLLICIEVLPRLCTVFVSIGGINMFTKLRWLTFYLLMSIVPAAFGGEFSSLPDSHVDQRSVTAAVTRSRAPTGRIQVASAYAPSSFTNLASSQLVSPVSRCLYKTTTRLTEWQQPHIEQQTI